MLKAAYNELGAPNFISLPASFFSLEKTSREPKFCFSFQIIGCVKVWVVLIVFALKEQNISTN
jgi:hypothetical protein